MAANVIFEIQVSDKGLKVSQKNVDNLGDAVDRTNRKTKEAGKAQDELNYKLNQGTTGVSSAAKSFSKLNQAIGAGPNGLVGAYATLAANAFALSAAFNVLKNASQNALVMKGLEIQGARLGVTLTNTAKSVQSLSGDMLSLATAMRATAQASAAGFKSTDIEKLTQVARDASVALGRDMGDSLDRLIRGTTKLEPELLDELGIMVKLGEATTSYALQNEKTAASLTSFEKRQAYLNAVIKEGTDKFAGIADQVKPDPYQQLATTFSDLIQKILELVNALGVNTIIKALADNTYLLGAAMLYFVSTISRSLLPGLYDLNKGLEVSAARLAYTSAEKYKAAAAASALATSEGKAALAQARTIEITKGSSNALIAYSTALRSGNATLEQRSKALRSLTNSINYYNKQVQKLGDTEKGQAAKQRLADLQAQKAQILALGATEQAVEERTRQAIQRTTAARREAARVRLQAAAAGKAADGMELIGQGNLKEGWDKVRQSLSMNFAVMRDRMKPEALRGWSESFKTGLSGVIVKLKETSLAAITTSFSFLKLMVNPMSWVNGFKTGLTAIRTGLTSLSGGAGVTSGALALLRGGFLATGAAAVTFGTLVKTGISLILYGIPIIGQIIMLLMMLWEVGKYAWEYFFPPSEAEKAFEEAQKSLTETIDRVKKTGEVTSEVFADAYASVTENTQAYMALSNTVVEVSESMKKLKNAREALNQADAANSSEALSNAFEQATSDTLSKSVKDSDAFKSIASLTELGFAPLNEEIMAATVNSQEFANANDSQKIAIMEQALDRLGRKYASVGTAVQELHTSYKAVDEATRAFIKSATPSTPYDGLVDSLTQASAATYRLSAELEKGTITADDFAKHISSLPEGAIGLVSQQTQQEMQKLSEITGQLAKAQQELDSGNATQTRRAQLESDISGYRAQQLDQQKKLSPLLQQDLRATLDTMRARQRDSVIAGAMLNLEKAKLATIQDNLSQTGAGYLAQQAHEERMRDMQVSKINAEKAVLVLLNAQTEQKLHQAEAELQALEAQAEQLDNGNKQLSLLDEIYNAWTRFANRFLNMDLQPVDAAGIRSQADTVRATIETLRSETASLGNAIEAAGIEAAAILAQNLTAAQKAARALSIDFENINKLANEINGIQAQIADTILKSRRASALFNSDIFNALSMQTGQLTQQLNIIRQQAQAKRQSINNQITSVNADINRTSDEAALKGLRTRLGFLQEENRLNNSNEQIQIRLAQIATAITLQETYKVDMLSNGLEIQQESLSLLEREYDLKGKISSQESELRRLRANFARGSSGTLNAELDASIQARAAREEYNLALESHSLKEAQITAEYALLDAQRLQLEYELRARLAFIQRQAEADGSISESERRSISAISTVIDRIQGIDYTQLEEQAQRVEDNNLELLRLRALNAEDSGVGAFSGVAGGLLQGVMAMGNFANNKQKSKLDIASDTAAASIEKVNVVVPNMTEATLQADNALAEFNTTLNSIPLETLSTSTEALSSAFTRLTAQFNSFLSDLVAQGNIAQAAVPGATLQERRQNAATANVSSLRARGITVGEWAGDGTVTGHQDTGHANRMAFDVQSGLNQAESIIRDALQRGASQVLWNKRSWSLAADGMLESRAFVPAANARGDKDHLRHIHVSFTNAIIEGAERAAPVIAQEISNAGSNTATDIANAAADTATKNVQVVTDQVNSSMTEAGRNTGNAAAEAFNNRVIPPVSDELPGSPQYQASQTANAGATPSPTITNTGTPTPNAADTITVSAEKAKATIKQIGVLMSSTTRPMIEELSALGPDGEVFATALAGMNNFVSQMNASFTAMNMTADQWKEATGKTMDAADMKMVKVAATMQMVSAAIGMVAQTLAAAANARMASIDKEIAAEEKRDGKSAASVEKTNALAKKKDDIARKSFNVQKKLQLAQAVINTASAITMALATLPPPWGAIMAGVIGAMGLAQVALIASTNYESSYSPKSIQTPSNLSVGKRSDSVNLAMGPNANAGGELAYIRGSQGTGSNASNYNAIGSAYGGPMQRGYGNRGFVVGEKGPEVITPETPITVTPANENNGSAPVNATINIQAIDSQGVQDVLVAQKGNIIQMLRQAANASGQRFLEDVNVNVYTRPNVGKLL